MEKYAWLIVLTLVQIVQFLLIKRNGKSAKTQVVYKNNPHPPGDAKTCREHGESIASIKTDILNIKDDLKRIERKLNGIK